MTSGDLAWLRSRRILLANNLPLQMLRRPLISEDFRYVTAAKDENDPRALRFPHGSEFDCGALDFGRGWTPELFIAKIDNAFYQIPRNVGALRCPRVLVLGITHLGERPLRRMIHYARSEPYDFFIVEHFRHHLWHYHNAGLRNLYWLPGLLHRSAPPPDAAPAEYAGRAVFIGAVGPWHPRRARLFPRLAAREPRFLAASRSLVRSFRAYREADVSVNMSLNGDLNRRTFEILSAGGVLLSDELTAESGIDLLLERGREYDSYRDFEELASRVGHYLEQRDDGDRLRAAGHARYRREYAPEHLETALARLVRGGEIESRYTAATVPRIRHAPAGPSHPDRQIVYEAIQELHRRWERVEILFDARCDFSSPADFLDLPRVRITVTGAGREMADGFRDYLDGSRDGARLRFCDAPDPAARFNALISTVCEPALLGWGEAEALVVSGDRAGLARTRMSPAFAAVVQETSMSATLFMLGLGGAAR